MRLWHKDLIKLLPGQQLLGQWRECCLIAKNIQEKGTPNHILVNKVMDYPIQEFINYTGLVYREMVSRQYNVHWSKFIRYIPKPQKHTLCCTQNDIFKDWHNIRYLIQCYTNLQEKYDCGGISQEEWELIQEYVENRMNDYSCLR